tara:strand:+ start:128 stop:319 length:192 start_codon:yes stop_codon:yes gene_type:complete
LLYAHDYVALINGTYLTCKKEVIIKPTNPKAIIDEVCMFGENNTITIVGNVVKRDLNETVSIA